MDLQICLWVNVGGLPSQRSGASLRCGEDGLQYGLHGRLLPAGSIHWAFGSCLSSGAFPAPTGPCDARFLLSAKSVYSSHASGQFGNETEIVSSNSSPHFLASTKFSFNRDPKVEWVVWTFGDEVVGGATKNPLFSCSRAACRTEKQRNQSVPGPWHSTVGVPFIRHRIGRKTWPWTLDAGYQSIRSSNLIRFCTTGPTSTFIRDIAALVGKRAR